MDAQRSTRRDGRLAALAPAGLAALVAGTLLTFSALAFNTAFDDSSETRKVAVSSPSAAVGRPVVLPTPPDADAGTAISATAPDIDREISVFGVRIGRSTADAAMQPRDETKNEQQDKKKQQQKNGRDFAPGRSLTSRDSSTDYSNTDTHRHSTGKGHLKARGKGHHKDHSQGHSADSHGQADPHGPSKSHGRSKAKKKD